MQQRLLLGLVLTVLLTGVHAQIYQWREANGRMSYSDQAPPNVDARMVGHNTPGAATSAVPAEASAPSAKSWAEQDREFRERRALQSETEQRQAKGRAEKVARTQYCSEQRRNLAMLERGGRIGRPNDKGEMEDLTDAQIKAAAASARERLAKDCAT